MGQPAQNSSYKMNATVIILAQCVVPMMMSGVSITLPGMGEELGVSAVMLALVQSIYMACAFALVLTIGRLADATDKAALFRIGLAVFTVVTGAITFLPSIHMIIVARAIQGVAGAVMAATGIALLMQIVPPDRRGRLIGLNIGSNYLGLAGGPVISGLLTSHFGWRWVYFAIAVPGLIGYLIVRFSLPGKLHKPRQRVNLLNSFVFFITIMLLVFGSVMIGHGEWGYLMLACGVVGMLLFASLERRTELPLLGFSGIRANRPLFGALLCMGLLYCSAMGVTFLMSLYLQVIRSFRPDSVGLLLVISPVTMAMVAPVAGHLSDRMPARRLAAIGASVAAGGLLLAPFIDADTSIAYVLAVLMGQGIGFALFSTPNISIIMHSVRSEESGMAGALASAMRTGGIVVGSLIVNLTMAINLGSATVSEDPPRLLATMTEAYSIIAFLACVAAIIAARWHGPGTAKHHQETAK